MKVLFKDENTLKLYLKQIRSSELKVKEADTDLCCNPGARGWLGVGGGEFCVQENRQKETDEKRNNLHKILTGIAKCLYLTQMFGAIGQTWCSY